LLFLLVIPAGNLLLPLWLLLLFWLSNHPSWNPHPFQGWNPNFLSRLMGEAQDMNFIREVVPVSGAEAMKRSRELATQEGIFVGISSGGTFAAALRIAEKAPKGSTILCMLPDTGERYLSTPLFADISVDMTEEEIAIAHSTPSLWLPAAQ
jgi:cysteine synthase A